MGLLAPLFLAGLAALTIPIVVHLVHRERKEPLAFPSLMFLRRVPFRSAKRQRIRYWLLFLMRAAALILIAAAFARPWLDSPALAAAGAGDGKDIVVMIDRSYSMSARGVWERAHRAPRDAVGGAGPRDRVAVIAFGEQAQVLARLDEPRSRAELAVNSLEAGSDVTRYAPAFRLAGSVLSRSRDHAEIIMITDRQRVGWRGVEQVQVPQSTTLQIVDVAPESARNLAVTAVSLTRSTFAGRQRLVPKARIVNRGDRAESVQVELHIDGRVQQARSVAVAPRSASEVVFDAMFAESAVGSVSLAANDDLAADDVAYFTTGGSGTPVVRIISGGDEASFYFTNALAAGEDAFEVHRANARLGGAELANTDVVIVLDAALPTGAAGDALREFVQAGGGLIVAGASGRSTHELLPVRAGSGQARDRNPASLVSIDVAHPIFQPFHASGAAPFAAPRFDRFVKSEPVQDALVLARFDDGSPALVEQRIGRGRVLFWGSSFSRTAGDFVLHPVFVPFVHQLVTHTAAGARVARTFTVGQVIDVNAFVPAGVDAVVATPGRQRVRIDGNAAMRTMRVAEPGHYQIRGAGQGALTQTIAANVDLSESDFTRVPAATFDDAITARAPASSAAPAALMPIEREQRQMIWWYLLIVAFALLALETVIGNRISTAWRT